MKRTLAVAVACVLALAGCTGGGSKPAASAAATTSTSPTTTATTSPTGVTTSASVASPSAATSGTTSPPSAPVVGPSAGPTPTASSSPKPPPAPAGAVNATQAAAVEHHADAVIESSLLTYSSKGLPGIETCSTLQGELADLAGRRSAGWKPNVKPGFVHNTPLGWVSPVAAGYPQQFLYEERYVQPATHFDAFSMNVFTRASASAPWKMCLYPNLFKGVQLPVFATVAKNVVPASSAKTTATAAHALGTLATYLTKRSAAKIAQPAGLTVPFGVCPPTARYCNPPGIYDPYFVPVSGVLDSYHVTVGKDPVFTYPLRDGGTLVIGSLLTTDRNTATGNTYLEQDSARSYWTVLVPPGRHHSVTVDDLEDVVLEVSKSGAVRMIGAETHDLAASTTAG